MLGSLLDILGLVLSGGGLVSSLRSSATVTELSDRLKRAETHLSSLTQDTTFIRANLRLLKDLDEMLRQMHACITVRLAHAAPPERVQQFRQNPTAFGGAPFQPWPSFFDGLKSDPTRLRDFLQVRVPILVVDSSGTIQASWLPRDQLELNDVFSTAPLATFEPQTVEALAAFLSRVEVARSPGDSFEVQFEEES